MQNMIQYIQKDLQSFVKFRKWIFLDIWSNATLYISSPSIVWEILCCNALDCYVVSLYTVIEQHGLKYNTKYL